MYTTTSSRLAARIGSGCACEGKWHGHVCKDDFGLSSILKVFDLRSYFERIRRLTQNETPPAERAACAAVAAILEAQAAKISLDQVTIRTPAPTKQSTSAAGGHNGEDDDDMDGSEGELDTSDEGLVSHASKHLVLKV